MDRTLYFTLLLFAATLLAVWGFVLVLSPFLAPIAWALCIAAITYAPYLAIRRAWGKPRLTALVMVLLTAVVILVPLGLVVFVAGEELIRMGETGISQWVTDLQEALPRIHTWVNRQLVDLGAEGIDNVAQKAAAAAPGILWGPLARGAWDVLGTLFAAAMGFILMFATQYFVYTEGHRISAWVRGFLPLSSEDTDRILSTLRTTTSSAVLGGVVVALIQGALGAIGYAVVGIQAPILWGLVTAFFSLLPVGGSALIWGPIVIYLFAVGQAGKAWMLLAWGGIIVSGIDNVLRPWILGRTGTRVHPMLLFFAILSGIGLFGMSGIVFGPLLIAFLMTLAQIYKEHVVRKPRAPDEAPAAAGASAPPVSPAGGEGES